MRENRKFYQNLFNSQHHRNVLCDYRGGSRIFLRRVVPDPDLEMVGEGGGDGGRTLKNFFRSKNKGGSGHPGPLPWIRHWRGCTTKEWREWGVRTPCTPPPYPPLDYTLRHT